jgi:dynein heavy chain
MLEKLDEFLKRIEPEIESITGNERDTASFMKMMRLFNEVRNNFISV